MRSGAHLPGDDIIKWRH